MFVDHYNESILDAWQRRAAMIPLNVVLHEQCPFHWLLYITTYKCPIIAPCGFERLFCRWVSNNAMNITMSFGGVWTHLYVEYWTRLRNCSLLPILLMYFFSFQGLWKFEVTPTILEEMIPLPYIGTADHKTIACIRPEKHTFTAWKPIDNMSAGFLLDFAWRHW